MKKKDIIKQIESFYSEPEVVRGAKHMTLLCFGNDSNTVLNALRECRYIIENVTETIKYDYIGQRSFTEFEVEFQEGISYDKTNNWIALDKTTPIGIISNTDKIDVQRFMGGHWETSNNCALDLFEDITEGWNKYRYRIREKKEPIRITKNFYFDMMDKYHEKLNNILDGRELIIID